MNDLQLARAMHEIAADVEDLDDLAHRVASLSVQRTQRRRALIVGLAAATVLLVSAGAVIVPRLASDPSTGVPGSPGSSTSAAPSTSGAALSRTEATTETTPTGPRATTAITPPAAITPTARLTATPGFGTTDLPAGTVVSVVVSHGALTDLKARSSDGSTLAGTFSADRTKWTSTPLRAGLGYRLTGSGRGPNGQGISVDGTYATIGAQLATPAVSPGTGATVGVAQPIQIVFPAEPVDLAAVEKAVHVRTSTAVIGAWHWLHEPGDARWMFTYRPQTYWPARISVAVQADLFGIRLRDGTTVGAGVDTGFATGRAQVIRVDATTRRLTVVTDCAAAMPPSTCGTTMAAFPATVGRGSELPQSGVHVLTEKLPTHLISNPMFTVAGITAHWQERMSNGEVLTPITGTDAHGKTVDLTRDSIALSAADAKALFDLVQVGDPVEVTGAGPAPTTVDGIDPVWNVPWSTWSASTGG